MKIKKISYRDKVNNWRLEETIFDWFTLLVGASGVGKTRILSAINSLKNTANGKIQNGIFWDIEFEDIDNNAYLWRGETSIIDEKISDFNISFGETDAVKAVVINEELFKNGNVLVNRSESATFYNEREMPRFSQSESIISILKEELLIKPIYLGFNKINYRDHSSSSNSIFLGMVDISQKKELEKSSCSLEEIQEINLKSKGKLYLASLHQTDIFNKIKNRYIEIFPQVEDLKVNSIDIQIEDEIYTRLELQIKEQGVSDWIRERRISSGMLRTLIHISEIYLCAEGSVFLIDEFENSLGVNCIDELTDDILSSGRQIQFIITSHHPYIINNIDFSYWKLVTRTASVVRTSPITDFINGKSSHDKFMQLIQLSQYQTGQDNPE